MRPETIKLLEENIGSTLFNIGLSNFFWICLLRQGKQAELNKWDHIKLHSFCTAKETIKTKRPPTELEKIFADNIFNKGSKIYKELIQLNIKKKKT